MESMLEGFLNQIKADILKMAGLVEFSLKSAIGTIKTESAEDLKKVYGAEEEINQLHRSIDKASFRFLARQAPKASDLRLILSLIKINTDLERMGDLACNIGYYAQGIIALKGPKIGLDLEPMTENVLWMVRKAIESLMTGNAELAQAVLERDDLVDELKDEAFKRTKQEIKHNPNILDGGLDIILVSRNLERVADHATNIAEDVIFATTGRDVRHGTLDEFNS